MNQAQIQDEDAVCIVCREGITNPICPECLAKEMRYWKPGIGLATPAHVDGTGVTCMFCGTEFSICAHCYSRDIYEHIRDQYPDLAQEFLDMFGLKEELLF